MSAAGTDQQIEPERPQRRASLNAAVDGVFFVVAGLATVWLATLVFTESFTFGWWGILSFVVFWLLLAYLALPRLHRILTAIYVPDYFIGRARTSDGLLGDPVNLAFRGDEASLDAAMTAARWIRADDVTLATSWRIVTSTLTRRSYDEAPVSPLFLFGRRQDVAYQQEVAGNPAKRHHVRFWRCPDGWLLPGGIRVDWLAAGTYDRRVGLSLFTLQITHKIDADIDVERDHIVATLQAADPGIGVRIVRDFSTGYHSRNGGGDTIRTDGDLPIVDVGRVGSGSSQARADAAASVALETVPTVPSGDRAVAPAPTAEVGTAKRAAFELPAALAATDVDARMPRPVTISAGAALVLVRALAGVAWIVAAVASWPALTDALQDTGLVDSDLPSAVTAAALQVVVAVVAVTSLVQALLAVLIHRGVNWARILVLVISTASISTAFAAWWSEGQDITITTTFVTLALDILVLLALSSRSARSYARRPRTPTRTPRGTRGARRPDGDVTPPRSPSTPTPAPAPTA